jgi:hypothetical protein
VQEIHSNFFEDCQRRLMQPLNLISRCNFHRFERHPRLWRARRFPRTLGTAHPAAFAPISNNRIH